MSMVILDHISSGRRGELSYNISDYLLVLKQMEYVLLCCTVLSIFRHGNMEFFSGGLSADERMSQL